MKTRVLESICIAFLPRFLVLVNNVAVSLFQCGIQAKLLPSWFTLGHPQHDEERQSCDNGDRLTLLSAHGRSNTQVGSGKSSGNFSEYFAPVRSIHISVRRETSKSSGLPFSTGVPSVRKMIQWSRSSDSSSGFGMGVFAPEKNFIKREWKLARVWGEYVGVSWGRVDTVSGDSNL